MNDCILIRDLELCAIVGVLPHEREKKQRLIFNVKIFTDFSRAGKSDDLSDAVDYSRIEAGLRHLVENSAFQLLEKLGEESARLILEHSEIKKVTLEIDKPAASRAARSVAVKLTRKNIVKQK